jgi:uncharacterized membrane protein YeaQ/YmgE (transglycosylase-associated protein family)
MLILAWAVLGLIVGFVTSRLVTRAGEGMGVDVTLGVFGGLLGGWLFDQFGPSSGNGLHLWSFVVAVTGAAVVLMGYHTIAGQGVRRV